MKSHAPERLENENQPEEGYAVPDYQTVELLEKARQNPAIDENTSAEFHRQAFDGAADETALRKEIRQSLKPYDEERIGDANANRRRELEGVLRLARNLRQKLAACKAVPDGVKGRIEEALLELEALD